MEIRKRLFGNTPEGEEVFLFTLINENGIAASVTNYGGIVTSLLVPDRDGNMEDIVLGFDTLEEYLAGHPYFGAIVGRYANRISNARFELDGEIYRLAANNGRNHLHGGERGLDKRVWDFETFLNEEEVSLRLTYLSPHLEEGYPGNLSLSVTYSLNQKNELKVSYSAETDMATPVNLSQHSYFNLTGGKESVLGHELMIDASRYTDVNDELIPTGKLPSVNGTGMDFREMKAVGEEIGMIAGGYDHNYVLDDSKETLRKAAILYEPAGGILMEVHTTHPGIQLYTGNFLDGTIRGKGGQVYHQYWGLCLETQHFPDSPNRPEFPSTILEPGKEYLHTTVFRFDTK